MYIDGSSDSGPGHPPVAGFEAIPQGKTKGEFLADLSNVAVSSLEHLGERAYEVFALSRDPVTYEVSINSSVEPEDYKADTPEQDWGLLEESISDLQGKKVVFIG